MSGAVAWTSGTGGTVLRTIDGGAHWENVSVPTGKTLDFRDVQAFDAASAFVLSSGPGGASRIYKTEDGGKHWRLLFTNPLAKGFYDGFVFWDKTHGIALSDPVDGSFRLLATEDGEHWEPLTPPTDALPPALPGEGGFAASGTCLCVAGKNDVWFATGGSAARVFRSTDRGRHWSVSRSPLVCGVAAQGIFSIAVAEDTTAKASGNKAVRHGRTILTVGGDYEHPSNNVANAAYSEDEGDSWTGAVARPRGYRSAVAFVPGSSPLTWIAVGTTGSDSSSDGGKTWTPLDNENYNAVSFAPSGEGWAVGPQGRIARFAKALNQ